MRIENPLPGESFEGSNRVPGQICLQYGLSNYVHRIK